MATIQQELKPLPRETADDDMDEMYEEEPRRRAWGAIASVILALALVFVGYQWNQAATREKAALILAQFEPNADRFGRIVLEQHRYAADAARGESACKGPAHHHVASLVDLAEQAGIAFDDAVGIDSGARRKNRRRSRFG